MGDGMNLEFIKSELEEMYIKEFLSIREIAEFIGCSRTTIHKKLKEFNIPRRKFNELRSFKGEVPCIKCGELKPKCSNSKLCKDCWLIENNRERYPCGAIVPLRLSPRPKRKYDKCLNCKGWIASWNKSGYCTSCWNLPGMKKHIANVFCKKCGKAITGHGKTGFCYKHSRKSKP